MRKAAADVGAKIKIGAQLVQTDPVNSWNAVDKHGTPAYLPPPAIMPTFTSYTIILPDLIMKRLQLFLIRR